jgi:hypothetical protein
MVSVMSFSQVGHGTVCPIPSAGYSMDCPQCGHSHLRKSLIDSLIEIQLPIAPIVHPKMISGKEFPSARFQCGIRIADSGMGCMWGVRRKAGQQGSPS